LDFRLSQTGDPVKIALRRRWQKAMDQRPGANDPSRLTPAAHFVRETKAQAQAVRKIVATESLCR
jgi:hypothetical protein